MVYLVLAYVIGIDFEKTITFKRQFYGNALDFGTSELDIGIDDTFAIS